MISKNQIKQVKQLETKKHRQQERLFVAEGPKVVGDLLAAGFRPAEVFATSEWIAQNEQLRKDIEATPEKQCKDIEATPEKQCKVVEVTPEELRKVSFLQHPQHVLAVFPLPSASDVSRQPLSPLTLALDGVQDPGNLGTIIRIADWFGIDTIVCSPDTADAWSPKVVQATMGSIARVNIVYTDLKEYLQQTSLPICGTLLDGSDIYAQELPAEAIIVMGNEGNGISDEIRQMVTHRLLIPQFRPGAESLNVAIATAITCSEFRRRSY